MTTTTTDAEQAEAEARRLMAERARVRLRWDTRAERARLLAAINAELDLWLTVAER